MILRTSIHFLVLSASIYFSDGSNGTESDDPNQCKILFGPVYGWSIDNLQNVTLDQWPWHCFLLHKIDHNMLDKLVAKSCPDILNAARAGSIGFVQFYLQKDKVRTGDDLREEILLAAASGGHLDLLKYLIENEAIPVDPNDVQLLLQAARGGNIEMIGYLIYDMKLNVSGKSPSQETPLHSAAAAGRLEAVHVFADVFNLTVNARTRDGFTPAHYAAMISLPVLRYLIEERGADLNAKTSADESLLHFAAKNDKLAIVKYLVEQKNMSVDLQTRRGETPLIYAIHGQSLANVKYFVEKRHVDINGKDRLGRSILHEAARSDLAVMKYFIDDRKMLDRINDVDNDGNTPALEAVKFRSLDVLKFLVGERNADTERVNNNGYDLLRKAVMERCLPIVKYLAEEKGFEIDKLSYRFLTIASCTADTQLCLWLDEYGRKMNYPWSVRSFRRK